MRRDDALLLDMLIAARKIRSFTRGLTDTEFYSSDLVQSAVLRELQVLGEAARLISEDTRTNTSSIEWRTLIGLRNRVVHEYFNLRSPVIWQIVQVDIPPLIAQLELMVPPDEGPSPGER